MCFPSAITSAFSFNVLCWLKTALSFYMGDARHNECGLMFGNLCSLTTGFDCLFKYRHSEQTKVKSWCLTCSLGVFSFQLWEAKACAEPRFAENYLCWVLCFSMFIESSTHWWRGKIILWLMQWRTCLVLLLFYLFPIHFWFYSVDCIFNAIFLCYCQRYARNTLLDGLERLRGDWVCSRDILCLREKSSSLGLSPNICVPPQVWGEVSWILGGIRTLVIKKYVNQKLEHMFVYCIKEYILDVRSGHSFL